MSHPTLTPAQTRALMWLDGEWKIPDFDNPECEGVVGLWLNTDNLVMWSSPEAAFRLTPAGLALKATLQREQSADAGPSDTEMLDWVERTKTSIECFVDLENGSVDYLVCSDALNSCSRPSLRAAIRAAMQSEPSTSAVAAGDNETSRGLES